MFYTAIIALGSKKVLPTKGELETIDDIIKKKQGKKPCFFGENSFLTATLFHKFFVPFFGISV